ncbi:MAG: hypothetical protein ACREAC_21610, partial [Blastocatellia bacterium]
MNRLILEVFSKGAAAALRLELPRMEGEIRLEKYEVRSLPGRFTQAFVSVKIEATAKPTAWTKIAVDDTLAMGFVTDGASGETFAGDIVEIETSSENGGAKVEIVAISPFVRLEQTYMKELSSEVTSLRALCDALVHSSGIWGKIVIDSDVDDEIHILRARDYPALSLLKQIFLEKDLVFDNERGRNFRISNRITFSKESEANIKVVRPRSIRVRATKGISIVPTARADHSTQGATSLTEAANQALTSIHD